MTTSTANTLARGKANGSTRFAETAQLAILSMFIFAALLLVALVVVPASDATAATSTRPAILIGNNWDGTTDIVDPVSFERLDRINVIPDKADREAEINASPDRLLFFLGIRQAVGEGHDQYNDDVFSSKDGSTIFVSRPSFADVVAIDLATKQIKWRTPLAGYRSDHMAISPDGTRLLVSASTGNVVHQIDTATGAITGEFDSGDSPHENTYSKDGNRVYHASIGRVYTPTDREPIQDTSKGEQFFQVVDGNTLEILKRIDIGDKLAEAGYDDMSSAMRPMTLSPDERYLYFQVSFFHGFVEYDLLEDKVLRVANLPLSQEAAGLQREEYLLDSAHHGISMNDSGDKLCVAGTMSDYAAIVNRDSFAAKIIPGVDKPYWATNSANGKQCYMSASGSDEVLVIDYASEQVVRRIPVGDHPQRVRNGVVATDIYGPGPAGPPNGAGPPEGVPGQPTKTPGASEAAAGPGANTAAKLPPLRFKITHRRSPIKIKGGSERLGCKAAKSMKTKLTRCTIKIVTKLKARKTKSGKRRKAMQITIATGHRPSKGASALSQTLRIRRAGNTLMRKHRRGIKVTVVATAVDSAGRKRTVKKRLTLRR